MLPLHGLTTGVKGCVKQIEIQLTNGKQWGTRQLPGYSLVNRSQLEVISKNKTIN